MSLAFRCNIQTKSGNIQPLVKSFRMPLGVFGMYFGCRAKSTAEKKNAATKIQDHDGFACVAGRDSRICCCEVPVWWQWLLAQPLV